jgi:putative nucleotidyltransferase with HDIG domain
MNLRDIEITADRAEDVLQDLIDGIDDIEGVERKLGVDVRNMRQLMRSFRHDADEYHNGEDVLEHTKWVLQDVEKLTRDMDAERKLVIRLAALMHDMGKAYTFEVIDGKHTFRSHTEKSIELAEVMLARHRKDLGTLYDRVIALVAKHDALMVLLNARAGAKGTKYLNKFMRESIYMGGHLDDLLTLAKADGNRAKVRERTLADIEGVLEDIAKVEREQAEATKAKERLDREFTRRLPEIQVLLIAEGIPEGTKVKTLSEINAILGKAKKYDLIKHIKAMLEG